MKKQLLMMPVLILLVSCTAQQNENKMEKKSESTMEQTTNSILPSADKFVKSPLRNRIKLELNAPVPEVWALVGKLERMPEYSKGLRKVDAQYDDSNLGTGYTCYFFPFFEGGKEETHNEVIKWYEPNVGYASQAHEPNVFGLQQSLNYLTFKSTGDHTILTWDVHFTSENKEIIQMNLSSFETALNSDIAKNLINKFGGKILENYIDKMQ